MSSFTPSERRLLALATRRFADECTNADHQLSPVSTHCNCRTLAQHVSRDVEQLERAQLFDAGREHLERRNSFPDQSWTSAALLREVIDSWITPPWTDTRGSLQRGVWATAALARLGERGLPPDALLRCGLQRRFRIRLTTAAVMARADLALRDRDSLRPSIAPPLLPWIEVLASCTDQTIDRDTDAARNLPVRIATAITGQFSLAVDNWLASSSIKDILGWRYDGEPHSGLVSDDLTIPGGESALAWLIDRLERTRLDEWREASLLWELRYLDEPLAAVADSGIPRRLLDERVTHVDLVIPALRRSARYRMEEDPILGGLSYSEVKEQAVALIGEGRLTRVVELLDSGVAEQPYHQQLRALLAFCLIPLEPERALDLLTVPPLPRILDKGLLGVNRAAAHLRCGDVPTAREELTTVLDGAPDSEVLLWPVASFFDAPSTPETVCSTTTHKWAREVLLRLRAEVDAGESRRST